MSIPSQVEQVVRLKKELVMTIRLLLYSSGGEKLGEVEFDNWPQIPNIVRLVEPRERFFRYSGRNYEQQGDYKVDNYFVEIDAPMTLFLASE